MAGERRINFGADATDARYAIEDTGDGANFVLARDTTGGTVLLEYDDSAGEWVNRGGVNMDGNDISNVGTVTANSVSTGEINNGQGNVVFAGASSGSDADTRLDNALSRTGGSDTLILEPAGYSTARSTLSVGNVIGTLGSSGNRTEIDADWTFDTIGALTRVFISGGSTVTIGQADATVSDIGCGGTLSINASRVTVSGVTNVGEVSFESGTSDGEAGVLAGGITRTDNDGSNNFVT